MYPSATVRSSVDVHNFLLEQDIPHEVVPTRGRFRSPRRMAAVLGLPRDQVGRVVLFESGDALVAAVLPAYRDADRRRVAEAAGVADPRPVPPNRVADLTQFLNEALPPVALPEGTRVVVDPALAAQEVIYFPGGETSSMLKIRGADLVRATDASVTAVGR